MKRPNIVWVLTDDQGMGDLACTGNPWIKTPNIDRFYETSTRMMNYHVGPTCAPTRSTLMTGHYANSTGVWHTVGGRSLLREDEWTLPTALRDGGYQTGLFGKWHLGDSYPYRACDRGFTKSINHGGGGISQLPDFWGNDYFDDTYMVNGEPQKFSGYCTDVFFEEGMRFIEENKDKPFFCYITPNAPHGPLNVPQKYLDLYADANEVPDNRKRFYAMITNIDENFGKLVDKLETLGILDNTIVIFMTDNGTATGISMDKEGNLTSGYNWGLQGMKNSEYDGGHRVPFFLRYGAENQNTGRDINTLTASVDIMPTLLDYCGIDVDANEHSFHGTSIVPLLRGEKMSPRTIVTDSQRLTHPVKWRKSAVMTDKWRLVNGKELYDINEDKVQKNDIANKHPEVVLELREEYEKWWDVVSVQFENEIPLHISSRNTVFTTHDSHCEDEGASWVWNQAQVRQGELASGYYETMVDEAGTYRFELRRWSKDFPHPICSDISEADDVKINEQCIAEQYKKLYRGSVALDIVKATIEICGQKAEAVVSSTDEAIVFELELQRGATHTKVHFIEKCGRVCVPYFVYISKIS